MSDPASQAAAAAVVPAIEPTPTTPPVETPKEPAAAPAAPPAESAAARFARLAAHEKRLQAQRTELQSARDAIAKEKAEIDAYRAKQASYKTNPMALLQDHGLTYEQLTQVLMNGGQPTPDLKIDATRGELQALKAELDALKQARADAEAAAQQAQAEKTAADYRRSLLQAATDGYELASVYDPEGNRAWAVAEALFNETGEIPKPAEVMAKVEAEFEALLDRAAKTKKWGSKYAPKPPEPPKPEPKTLDNSLGASPTMVNGSAKTEAERIRRAIEAMEAIEKKQPSA